MGSYNNCDIIHLTPKSTPFDAFDDLHQILLDRMSDNMASLFQSGKYSVINTYITTTNRFYVIKLISEAYTLQNNSKIDGNNISAGEFAVKSQYLFYMQ